MKIWHVGDFSSPDRVDGVSNTAWLLSRAQARLGHDVSLVIDSPPDDAAVEIAADEGMKLVQTSKSIVRLGDEVRRILAEQSPDLVHMHSVFIPQQAVMARVLRQLRIPYVITPAGGLLPQVLRRGMIKKELYGVLLERPRFMGASGIAIVTPGEERAVRAYLPDFRRPIRWIPNPVAIEKLGPHRWRGLQGEAGQRRIAFLGRFDVLCKGIDILIEIARLLPEVRFDLYGTEDAKTRDWLEHLKQNLPPNVAFHDPIFGPDKGKMLAESCLYLQPSRWEGFPISVAECLYLGVPCAITEALNLAQVFREHDLGLLVALDPSSAAARIRAALADETRMRQWSLKGQEFARTHFHPRVAAERHLALYQEAIDCQSKLHPACNGAGTSRGVSGGSGAAARVTNGHASLHGTLVPAHLRGSIKRHVSRMIERSGSHSPSPDAPPRTIVLCYHSVARTDFGLAVDPQVLREQIGVLRELGYEFQRFCELADDLRRHGASTKNVACITFDDGYEDNLTQAAPLLLDLGVPATVFVTTGLMLGDASVCASFCKLTGYDRTFLSTRQVAQLHRAGFEIGAHTHTHRNMAALSVEDMRQEVERSKSALEEATGGPVRTFAYPFGKRSIHYTPKTVAAVREAGFRAAAAVAFRSVPPGQSVRIFEVPRFFVSRGDTPETFRQKVCGHFDWLGAIQEHAPRWLKGMVSPEDRY
jgi:glycosyltransferase involved in cell wall biosynthesis/peptidoglycan/xylan/chitin deacetylase (PgdA/CDA1 family)